MNIGKMSLTELKELAKKNGIKNISKFKKDELLEKLSLLAENKEIDESKKEDNITENGDCTNQSGYKLTSDGDEIVEGILEVLPDGYGFLREKIIYQVQRMYIYLQFK